MSLNTTAIKTRHCEGDTTEAIPSTRGDLKKLLLIMKLTAFLLLTACLAASAAGKAQRISLNEKAAPLEKIFSSIEKQTGYSFVYTDKQLSGAKKVTVQLNNATLEQALDACFKDQPFTYAITDKFIVIKERNVTLSGIEGLTKSDIPPPIDIHGRVVDENGKPVIASVQVKGTNKGTTTNDNGEFELKGVDDNATLVISGVSIESFEVKVSGRSEFALNAKIRTTMGENVTVEVNTGYQRIPKERATGAFEFVTNEELNRKVGTDILSRLDGVSSGLLFDRRKLNADANTITANNIIIRGLSTLTESMKQPLVVVNNMPYDGDINNINPNDVESITVLKDAAAASIWGARAGNGVIVITTKQGKFNQPLRVSFNTNVNVISKPDLFEYPQMSVSDYIDVESYLFNKGFFNSQINNTSTRPPLTPVIEILTKRRSGLISATDSATQINALKKLDVRNDFDKYVYQTAVNQQYSINLSGGSNLMRYSFSSGFDKTPSVLIGNNSNRITLRLDNSIVPTKNLEIQIGIGYSNSTTNTNSLGNYGSINYGFKTGRPLYPYAQLADNDGNSLSIAHDYRLSYLDTAGGGKLLSWQYKPLDEIKLANNKNTLQDLLFNTGLTYKFTTFLSGQISYQYEHTNTLASNLNNQETYFTRNQINLYSAIQGNTIKYNIPLGGILFENGSELKSQTGRGQINFNKTIQNKNEVTAIVGGEIRDRSSTGNSRYTYGFNDKNYSVANVDFLTSYRLYIGGFSTIPSALSYKKLTDRFVSLYGNAAYTYDGRYTISGSFRKDAANLFGVETNNKWKPLWSVGGAWNLHKESFFSSNLFSYLRLRTTYGYQGNVNNTISPKTTISVVPSTSGPLNINQTYASILQPGDPSLSWETINQTNVGIDSRLLRDRISLSVEAYQKNSNNLIWDAINDPTTGFPKIKRNSASIRTRGLELTTSALTIKTPFQWQTELIFNYTRNTVTDYQLDDKITTTSGNSGLSIRAIYKNKDPYGVISFPFAGLDPASGDPLFYVGKNIRKDYSAISTQTIDTGHFTYHGSNIPRIYGSFNNSFSYKGVTLIAAIIYGFDYYFFKNAISYGALFNGTSHPDYAKRWQQPGDENITNVPSMVYPANTFRDAVYQASSINVLRGDNIRLQNIKLSYSITTNNKQKLPFRNLQLYTMLNNLGIIWRANKEGLDPDYNTGNALFPPLKSYAVGVTAIF